MNEVMIKFKTDGKNLNDIADDLRRMAESLEQTDGMTRRPIIVDGYIIGSVVLDTAEEIKRSRAVACSLE